MEADGIKCGAVPDVPFRSVRVWSVALSRQKPCPQILPMPRPPSLSRNHTCASQDLEIDFGTFDQKQVTGQPITSQIGIWPPAPEALVSQVVADSPAEAAGLQPDDLILSVDGEAVANWFEMATIVSQKPGQSLRFGVLRNGETLEVDIVPNTVVRRSDRPSAVFQQTNDHARERHFPCP